MSFYGYGGYHVLTVDELRRKAEIAIRLARAKKQEIFPVTFTGKVSARDIAKSWWGKAWCNNLERYADFSNRIERGKKYVKGNTVIDLHIELGSISAKVIGSRKTPYNVEITIKPLKDKKIEEIKARCTTRIESLEALLNGEFPEEMKELFFEDGVLFPTPREIKFNCSCPDWAVLCKHVAATLYGVGVRLDEDPLLFFTLRGIDVNQFIGTAIANRVENMLSNVDKKSSRIIADSEIMRLFGV